MPEAEYTGVRALLAEGARVGFVTCKLCGAAIMVDPMDEFSAIERHTAWHAERPMTRQTLIGGQGA